jgi:hypothetical protein
MVWIGVFRGVLQEEWALVSHCVFRVLEAHPTSLHLVRFGLECVRALAPGLSDPAAVLHQLLGHDPVQALCRQMVHDLQLPLVLATSALQMRMVSVPVLAWRRSRVARRLFWVALRVASDVQPACFLVHTACRARWMRGGQACAGPGALRSHLHASIGPGCKHCPRQRMPGPASAAM